MAKLSGRTGRWVALAALGVAYFLAGRLSLDAFASLNASASPVWPPTGIALAGLLILGLRAWPAILAGAFLFNLQTSGDWPSALAIAGGNTLEAVVGVVLIRRFAQGRDAFDRLPSAMRFALLAGLAAPALGATVGVASLVARDLAPAALALPIWLTWWLGDAGGALIVTPVLVTWAKRSWRIARPLESAAALAATVAFAWLAFATALPTLAENLLLAFALLPTLAWVALRLDGRLAAMAVLATAAVAVWGTLEGLSPLPQPTTNEALLLLQIFLAVVALAVMTLAAAAAEWFPTSKGPRSSFLQSPVMLALTLVPLVVGTLMTGLLTSTLTARLADDRFDNHADTSLDRLDHALRQQEEALHGLRAFYAGSTEVTTAELIAYVNESQWLSTRPGVLVVGQIEFVAAPQQSAWVSEARADPDLPEPVRSSFAIHPPTAADALVIRRLSPLQGNEPALGLDLRSETNRNTAATRAIATGALQMTGPIVLVQDPSRGPGVLLLLALEPGRAESGLVYTGHRVDHLVAAALDDPAPRVALVDVTTPGDPVALYGDVAGLGSDVRLRDLTIGGRQWQLAVGPPSVLLTSIEAYAPWLGLAGAGLLSFVLVGLVYQAAETGRRAQRLAQSLSAEALQGQRSLEEAQAIGHVGSWEWDVAGNRLTWSRELHRLFGLEPGAVDVTFELYQSMLHPDDRDLVLDRVQKAVADGQDFAFDHRIVRRDGEARWISSRGRVVQDEGRTVRLLGTALDITDRKALDNRFRRVLEAAPDAIVMADLNGHIVLANRQAEAMFGRTHDDLLACTIEDLVPERFRGKHAGHRAAFHGSPRQRPMGMGLDLYAVRRDGSEFPVEISLSPLELDGGPVVVATVRDITDRKKSEALLHEGRRQLEAAEKLAALGTLVAGVGHEIRTPLTYIMTRLALIELKIKQATEKHPDLAALATDLHAQVDSAKQGVWRIDRIVQQLRGFVKGQLNPAPADLKEVVQQATELFRAAHKGQCDVQLDLAEGLPPTTVDRSQIQQVLINLLNNAAEAMPKGGTVHVRARPDQDHIVVEVEDKGIGIPVDVQRRLFDPFFTTKSEGTGLGLSVSKRIVEAHHGTLTYQTQVGQGTTFRVRLPVVGPGVTGPALRGESRP